MFYARSPKKCHSCAIESEEPSRSRRPPGRRRTQVDGAWPPLDVDRLGAAHDNFASITLPDRPGERRRPLGCTGHATSTGLISVECAAARHDKSRPDAAKPGLRRDEPHQRPGHRPPGDRRYRTRRHKSGAAQIAVRATRGSVGAYLAEAAVCRLRKDRSTPRAMGSAPKTRNTVSPTTRIHSNLWKLPFIR